MVAESFAAWFFRTWAENFLPHTMWVPNPLGFYLGPLRILPGINFLLPFRKRMSRDLPTWVANHSSLLLTINVGYFLKHLMIAGIEGLDLMKTPGGIQLDHESLQAVQDNIDDEDFFVLEFYQWDYLDIPMWYDEAMVDDYEYSINDWAKDLQAGLMLGFAGYFGVKYKAQITKPIMAMFGKVKTMRRNKAMKERQERILEAEDEARQLLTQVSDYLIDELDPDVKILIDGYLINKQL